MTPSQLIADTVRRKLGGAEVLVTSGPQGYTLRVAARRFDRITSGDAQAQVYTALDRLPAELVARIAAIECLTA